jgi:hypothetical protein
MLNEKNTCVSTSDANNPGHVLPLAEFTLILETATINSDEFLVFCNSEGVSKFLRLKNNIKIT